MLFCSGNAKQNLVAFNQNDLQMELFQIYISFFHKLSIQNGSAVTKNSENIKQAISQELPNGFCQNMCPTDAFKSS